MSPKRLKWLCTILRTAFAAPVGTMNTAIQKRLSKGCRGRLQAADDPSGGVATGISMQRAACIKAGEPSGLGHGWDRFGNVRHHERWR